ncbi:MAG: hypothetical protein RIB80_15735 [Rhodospirillales bacterium]
MTEFTHNADHGFAMERLGRNARARVISGAKKNITTTNHIEERVP